uniref:hypothetical protein n=1 Tax=Marinobacterium profundum TaxID=1714300 RepID=UPI000829B513|nr:hypothetical protein [Marinobacterium profundum]
MISAAARVWRDAWLGMLLGLLVTLSVMALAAEPEGKNPAIPASRQDPLDSPKADHDPGQGAADGPVI